MDMYLRYKGNFGSRDEKLWTAEIWQKSESAFAIGELDFDGDEPLTIEWEETEKKDVIQSSSATMNIISPGDRTYEDMYAIEAGSIRLDVKLNGELYWSGTLDPEQYEEPYSETEEYIVTLTFSDFGILERLKWNYEGMVTLKTVLGLGVTRAGLGHEGIDESMISTQLSAESGEMKLLDLSVRSENFYDEDGEASTMKDVIEGVMQPLALKMIQRDGKIYVYDLNGLANNGTAKAISWASDDQVLGVDAVANDMKVTFSPYSGQDEVKINYKGTDTNTETTTGEPIMTKVRLDQSAFIGIALNPKADWDTLSFKMLCSRYGSGLESIGDGVKYFKIAPVLSSEEAEGVVYGFKYGHGNGVYTTVLTDPAKMLTDSGELMTTKSIFIPRLTNPEKYMIKVSMEMLVDVRYNPFTDKNDYNERWDYDDAALTWTMAAVDTQVDLLDDGGNVKLAFGNANVNYTEFSNPLDMSQQGWSAIKDNEPYPTCRLGYYDKEDLKEGCAIMGWKTNRQYIGLGNGQTWRELRAVDKEMDDGQYIPYPPDGGWLRVTVMKGMKARNWSHHGDNHYEEVGQEYYDKLRWVLYKAPQLEIVDASCIKMKTVECDDILYKGVLNAQAKEDIEIDTVCGTMKEVCPTARGCFYKTSDGLQISTLYRGGQTNQAERLLIGTLYSQHASRHTKLSGTTEILTDGLMKYTEAMQEGKEFILVGDVENVGEGTSEMTIVELSKDSYEPSESDLKNV